MTTAKGILDGVDLGADLGIIGALVASMFAKGAGNGRFGQFAERFVSNGGAVAMKQHFGKWFGIGKTDEAELWKTTLGLVGQIGDDGVQNVLAINQLLEAMNDDEERYEFRSIITAMSAGASVSSKTGRGISSDHVNTETKSFLDSPEDLRVKTLETIAKIVRDKENGGVDIALKVLRNQGLGKESELTILARKYWKKLNDDFIIKYENEVLEFLTELNTRWDEELGEVSPFASNHPSIFVLIPYKMFLSGQKIPFSESWEFQLVKKLFYSKQHSGKFKPQIRPKN